VDHSSNGRLRLGVVLDDAVQECRIAAVTDTEDVAGCVAYLGLNVGSYGVSRSAEAKRTSTSLPLLELEILLLPTLSSFYRVSLARLISPFSPA